MDRLIDFSGFNKTIDTSEPIVDITALSKNKKPKRNLQQLIKDTNAGIVTKDITQALFLRFSNHRYVLNNTYIFKGWESDFVTVTESMYLYEVESKMTKSDFKEDFLKKEKHLLLESSSSEDNLNRPNKFYYCAPRGLLASYEIPSYAGFMEVSRVNGNLECNTVKEAPFLHKDDVFSTVKDAMLQKLAWRYRDIMLADYDNAINILQSEKD
jgi:hypothetical protein